ncbi:branched-chain amino acid ABC transporter permease [Allonocardiopsis opalescens]|uniref:Amino acid/amide ABC transporter membrane protein 1 (HAAT family) n=1 Tax=Allonocardiopsis opalescens TaxID=1144618 RepID=A0A2T0Q0T6_9ACTN|nr:branched-chain amino acid ABC transporter permease [Allonocardiopsis opalescens]PRX97401.1 amino acid/amide ABC transporter membrane protein 1 (HAAT family) [Allonocardiopsis opalescens]
MEQLAELVLNGVSSGAVYAALALSLMIIYQATRVVNFAQPGLALIAAYTAFSVTRATGSYWLGFVLALVVGGALGVLAERLLIRPVQRRSELSAIIVTLGLLMLLQGVAGMVWSNEPHSFPYPLDFRGRFSATDAFAVAAVGVTALGLLLLFRYTPLGLRMRAAAFRPEVARMVGVRVGLMLTVGWGIASVIGALAGMLAVPPFIFPNVLDGVFVYGITAAVIGGLDNPFGAVLGGFTLGIGLSLVSGYLGPELVTLAALVIVVVVLSLRPDGLFTRPRARQV